jgi:hypothetical protein
VVINQDISALFNAAGQPAAGAQQSMVEDIVYTFSEPVNIVSNVTDRILFQINALSVNGFTGVVPATIEWAAVAGSNDTQWEVDFGVNPYACGSQTGALNSLANGCYTVTITDFSKITAVSDGHAANITTGAAPAAGNPNYATQSFYRLFGDINGDEIVNGGDCNKFKQALTTYNAAFDVNQDGFVNAGDANDFKPDLTVGFSGFTPTI